MRIGELSRRTGLAPSAIRHYEREDMFSPGQVVRGPNGYREYGPEAVRRLELILAGRNAGFSLEQMRTQLRDWDTMSDAQRLAALEGQLAVIDERRAELERGREAVRLARDVLRERLGGTQPVGETPAPPREDAGPRG